MKLSKIMERAKMVRGARYASLYMNLSGISDLCDINDIYRYVMSFVSKLPARSLTLLFDLSGLSDSLAIREKLEEMTMECSKYFVQTALVTDNKVGEDFKSYAYKHGLEKGVKHFTNVVAAKEYILTYGSDADLRHIA